MEPCRSAGITHKRNKLTSFSSFNSINFHLLIEWRRKEEQSTIKEREQLNPIHQPQKQIKLKLIWIVLLVCELLAPLVEWSSGNQTFHQFHWFHLLICLHSTALSLFPFLLYWWFVCLGLSSLSAEHWRPRPPITRAASRKAKPNHQMPQAPRKQQLFLSFNQPTHPSINFFYWLGWDWIDERERLDCFLGLWAQQQSARPQQKNQTFFDLRLTSLFLLS